MNADYWLDRAVAEIRFAPDREAVRKELSAHLEDRRESLEAKGLSAYEAEKAATEAMGDPAELAEELAKLHRPYWGWILRATQLSLAALIILSLFTLIPNTYYKLQSLFTRQDESYVWSCQAGDVIFRDDSGYERVVDRDWHPEGSKTLGNYRFTVPHVWLERWELQPDEETNGWVNYNLVIIFRADSWRFWEPASGRLFDNGTGTDSEGHIYSGNANLANILFMRCQNTKRGPFSTWYRVELDQEALEELPDWVELPVGYGGDTIRVDLRNEVIS